MDLWAPTTQRLTEMLFLPGCTRVNELMALCDQLEAQLTATEADSRRLLEAVLHEALNPPVEALEQTRLGAHA
jgi:hypothetical protein